MGLTFVKPSMKYVNSYAEALEEGPFTHMALGNFGDITAEELRKDPEGYIKILNSGLPREVTTSDGKNFTLSDHEILWVVDGNNRFIGGISLRYDDNALINEYAGHAGMSVRHGLIGKGYGVRVAKQGWDYVIEQARKRGLKAVRASGDPDNPNSYRMIEHMGGVLVGEPDMFGWGKTRLYEIKVED